MKRIQKQIGFFMAFVLFFRVMALSGLAKSPSADDPRFQCTVSLFDGI